MSCKIATVRQVSLKTPIRRGTVILPDTAAAASLQEMRRSHTHTHTRTHAHSLILPDAAAAASLQEMRRSHSPAPAPAPADAHARSALSPSLPLAPPHVHLLCK